VTNYVFGFNVIISKIIWAMKNLIAPLDRARRVVLGTHFGTLGTGS
jgi:hypothetical protein